MVKILHNILKTINTIIYTLFFDHIIPLDSIHRAIHSPKLVFRKILSIKCNHIWLCFKTKREQFFQYLISVFTFICLEISLYYHKLQLI